jgi:hypothetical protein
MTRTNLIAPFPDRELRFVIRQTGDHHVLPPSGKKRPISRAVQWCRATAERIGEVKPHVRKRRLRLGAKAKLNPRLKRGSDNAKRLHQTATSP